MTSDPQGRIVDSRRTPLFIHSELDDLGLSLEAFRVYAHIARRAGRANDAFPSYASIGEVCFRGSYPNAPISTLKAKAIAAVQELLDYGLIRKQSVKNNSNHYHLTEIDEWKKPGSVQSCNIRKGRQGLTRRKKQRLTGITPPVNGNNLQGLTEITPPVNGDNLQGLTGITPPVNGDNPKDIQLRYSNEGTPTKERVCGNLLDSEVSEQADATPVEPAQPSTIAATQFVHPTVATEARMNRGAKLEAWEVGHGKPNPEFLEWIVKNDKSRSSALPLPVKARQMLYHARDKRSGLDAALWEQFQEEVIKPRDRSQNLEPAEFVFMQPEPEPTHNDREALIARLRGRIASRLPTEMQAAMTQAKALGIPLAELGLEESRGSTPNPAKANPIDRKPPR